MNAAGGESPEVSGRVAEANAIPTRNRWFLGLLLAFCCGHAAFLISSIVPERLPYRKVGGSALGLYAQLFAGGQRWIMFNTIPIHRSMVARFERIGPTGSKETAGCILPGLKPYPQPEDPHFYTVFFRLLFSSGDIPYRDAYFRKASQILPPPSHPGVSGEWSMVMDAEYTRTLVHVRRDKKLTMPFTQSFSLAPQTGESR